MDTVLLRTWNRRQSLSFSSDTAWLAYLRLGTDNELQSQRSSAFAKRTQELPTDDLTYGSSQHFMEQLAMELESQELALLADRTWLGPRVKDFDLRLLVATVIFSDGKRLGHGLELLRRLECPHTFGSVQQFLAFLCEPTVVRTLIYQSLHFRPPQLYTELSSEGLDPVGLAPYLRCRFGYYEPLRIVSKRIPPERKSEFETTIALWQSRLPFEPLANRLVKRLRKAACEPKYFEKDPLWKRLVFQYHLYATAHEDILAWLGPAAVQCGAKLDKVKLNGWISGRRLEDELVRARQSGEHLG